MAATSNLSRDKNRSWGLKSLKTVWVVKTLADHHFKIKLKSEVVLRENSSGPISSMEGKRSMLN